MSAVSLKLILDKMAVESVDVGDSMKDVVPRVMAMLLGELCRACAVRVSRVCVTYVCVLRVWAFLVFFMCALMCVLRWRPRETQSSQLRWTTWMGASRVKRSRTSTQSTRLRRCGGGSLSPTHAARRAPVSQRGDSDVRL
jgi:hypothetical protein